MGLNFLRRDWNRFAKLGRKRKNKQVWRSPKGRDNKMREKRKGYPKVVSVGYEKEKDLRGKINGKDPITITKVSELGLVEGKKDKIAVIGKVGKKRKMEIAKKAQEKKIELANLNPKKYLKQAEFENKKKKEEKEERSAKKKAREKASKKAEKKEESSEKSDKEVQEENKETNAEKPKEKKETESKTKSENKQGE